MKNETTVSINYKETEQARLERIRYHARLTTKKSKDETKYSRIRKPIDVEGD